MVSGTTESDSMVHTKPVAGKQHVLALLILVGSPDISIKSLI
jgi:hypothetical protein